MEKETPENSPKFPEMDEAEKLRKAEDYWESRLSREERIPIPQAPECLFSIVVPVYAESVDRILKQVGSLREQTMVPLSFELIYVVNNDVGQNNAVDLNRKIIETISKIQDLAIFAIDKSSVGHEILDCNVGRARNRGVAEASRRFYEKRKNGIIIQTDADTYFDDPDYLKKVAESFEASPGVIGIAGGIIFEFNPDTKDQEKVAELRQKIDRFILLKKWEIMNKFLTRGEKYSPFQGNSFSGANMISRSFESAVIGGLRDIPGGEDPQFGRDLAEYGENNYGSVIGKKEELKVVTALRESDRTPASFKRMFDGIDLGKPPEFKGTILTDDLVRSCEREVLTRPGGKDLLESIERQIRDIKVGK